VWAHEQARPLEGQGHVVGHTWRKRWGRGGERKRKRGVERKRWTREERRGGWAEEEKISEDALYRRDVAAQLQRRRQWRHTRIIQRKISDAAQAIQCWSRKIGVDEINKIR
jgi:hypothetical protein